MNGKIAALSRHGTRWVGALALVVAFFGLAADAVDAQEMWYAEKYAAGDVPISVEQLWSRGPLFRSETVIAGHPIVTLVRGDRYIIIDRLTQEGVSIERHPKALKESEAGKRPFGVELDALLAAGGEFVREQDFAGNKCDLYRLTSQEGRREVCATQDDEKLPVLTRVWMRSTQRRAETRFVNWTRQVQVPEVFFDPDPRIVLRQISYQEYIDRVTKDLKLPAPPLYRNLLHGTR
ncbi:MAG: hypothetical protein JRH01_00455 [Deltaproteobacteria bacterium]|nr:hypothetical protein [Deltaproteobacteria bacterium]MBW2394884.1 hypothetical protein [Deltaproteobacteria bacterium]